MNLLARIPVATIVIAQLFGTSLWFSPNSAAQDLARVWTLTAVQLGYLTSAVQVGFIFGTLFLAMSGLADRFSAAKIFAISCVLGALFNAMFALLPMSLPQAISVRMAVGICLAGIYPLGMKMVISWSTANTGASLGLLVAMLTLGTALPHAIRAAGGDLPWQGTILTSSILALVAAYAIFYLGDGPYLKKKSPHQGMRWGAALRMFRNPTFRASSLGYFGHMWELYAFWTIVPFFVAQAIRSSSEATQGELQLTSLLSFMIIAAGAIGSILAGALSKRFGSPMVAAGALATSGFICLVYPQISKQGPAVCVIALIVWGVSVVADSAQFSSIVARSCPETAIGSALALQNSIGFLFTVLSITVMTSNIESMGSSVAWLLLPGPLVGLLFFSPIFFKSASGELPLKTR